jgi:hypothetical protein
MPAEQIGGLYRNEGTTANDKIGAVGHVGLSFLVVPFMP